MAALSGTIGLRHFTSRSGTSLAFTELGLGTGPLGNLYQAIDGDLAQLTLVAAWDVGVRYFDTAPLYGLGLAETRLNPFLRGKPRDDYLLSTKVGRLLQRVEPEQRTGIGKFFETPSRREIFDYSYDGVLRSVEASLERLGVDRIDILYAHDLDVATHGTPQARDERINAFMASGYPAMDRLRGEGVVSAIGAGLNEWQAAETLARAGDFDIFLLAGRYTLLEQTALETFLPYCARREIGVIAGGPFNSGILATGPYPGAFYDYAPAPARILDRVARIERVCAAYRVRLAEAALRFPLGHPSVLSVLPGAQASHEIIRNSEMIGTPIPSGLWSDLKSDGLLVENAPVPR